MPEKLCEHGRAVCSQCQFVTDAAKRAYDIARSYCAFVNYDTRIRGWIAFRLEDGGSDGTLYDNKRDAIRHQSHEQLCAYFSYRGSPNGFATAKEAAVWLEYHRHIYARGGRTPDPDDAHGGPDIIMPTTKEQLMAQLRDLMPWNRVNN